MLDVLFEYVSLFYKSRWHVKCKYYICVLCNYVDVKYVWNAISHIEAHDQCDATLSRRIVLRMAGMGLGVQKRRLGCWCAAWSVQGSRNSRIPIPVAGCVLEGAVPIPGIIPARERTPVVVVADVCSTPWSVYTCHSFDNMIYTRVLCTYLI